MSIPRVKRPMTILYLYDMKFTSCFAPTKDSLNTAYLQDPSHYQFCQKASLPFSVAGTEKGFCLCEYLCGFKPALYLRLEFHSTTGERGFTLQISF